MCEESRTFYQAIAQQPEAPEQIIEDVHAGRVRYAAFQALFADWRTAAKSYADLTARRFGDRGQADTCDLCSAAQPTTERQFLFRVVLEQQWGKKIHNAMEVLAVPAAASYEKTGTRLVFPTFHRLCGSCVTAMRSRAACAGAWGWAATFANLVLVLAVALAAIGVVVAMATCITRGDVPASRVVLSVLILVAAVLVLVLVRRVTRYVEYRLRFPRALRHIASGPFRYVPKTDSTIDGPIILRG